MNQTLEQLESTIGKVCRRHYYWIPLFRIKRRFRHGRQSAGSMGLDAQLLQIEFLVLATHT